MTIKKKIKYYHASSRRYSPGYHLIGHSTCPNHPGLWVFLTDSPVPHFTIASNAVEENWHIYEVIPQGKCKLSHFEQDIIAKSVIIKRRVGNARGIHGNWIKGRNDEALGSNVSCTSMKRTVVNSRLRRKRRKRK